MVYSIVAVFKTVRFIVWSFVHFANDNIIQQIAMQRKPFLNCMKQRIIRVENDQRQQFIRWASLIGDLYETHSANKMQINGSTFSSIECMEMGENAIVFA